jgi:hypothetical protein
MVLGFIVFCNRSLLMTEGRLKEVLMPKKSQIAWNSDRCFAETTLPFSRRRSGAWSSSAYFRNFPFTKPQKMQEFHIRPAVEAPGPEPSPGDGIFHGRMV